MPRILLGVTLAGALCWIALGSGGLDREGKPIGTDFVSFWTASRLALDGRPDLAYDVGAHWAAQKALFGPKLGYTAFFYPPPALLICLPLALAPYFWSLAAWLAATGYAYFRVVRGFLPGLDPVTICAFPAVFDQRRARPERFPQRGVDRRRPSRHGPQARARGRSLRRDGVQAASGSGDAVRAYLRPPLDDVGRRRGAAAASVPLSLARVRRAAWRGFLADSPLARSALEHNLVGNEKMQSVFAAVRLLHGSLDARLGSAGGDGARRASPRSL